MYWGGLPHGYLSGSAFEVVWITLPLGDLRTWQVNQDFITGLLAGQVIALRADMLRMDEWIAQLRQTTPNTAAERIALHELAALMLRAESNHTAHLQPEIRVGAGYRKLHYLTAFITIFTVA